MRTQAKMTLPLRTSNAETLVSPGDTVASRYRVVRSLGEGATATVFEVEDIEVPGRRLALKLQHDAPSSADELATRRHELSMMARVRHPSVIALYDHGLHAGRLYSVSPLLENVHVDFAKLSRKRIHAIAVQLAEALAAIHAVGLTHQDIKPDNVSLARFDGIEEPVAVLLDLGTAVAPGAPLRGLTMDYAAPEALRQFVSPGPHEGADARSDVYSLAKTIREWLEPIPSDENDQTPPMVRAITLLEGTVPPFRSWRLRWLDRYFARWLDRDPSKRPSSVQFVRELDALVLVERNVRVAKRVTAALLVAVVAVVGMVQWQRFADSRREEDLRKASMASRRVIAASERRSSVNVDFENADERARKLNADIDEDVSRLEQLLVGLTVAAAGPGSTAQRARCRAVEPWLDGTRDKIRSLRDLLRRQRLATGEVLDLARESSRAQCDFELAEQAAPSTADPVEAPRRSPIGTGRGPSPGGSESAQPNTPAPAEGPPDVVGPSPAVEPQPAAAGAGSAAAAVETAPSAATTGESVGGEAAAAPPISPVPPEVATPVPPAQPSPPPADPPPQVENPPDETRGPEGATGGP